MRMSEQWPLEQRAQRSDNFENSSLKMEQDFLNILNVFSTSQQKAFDNIVDWIVEQDGDILALEELVNDLAKKLHPTISNSLNLLMSLSCAAALDKSPSLITWKKINAFKYKSCEIESWLTEAMLALAGKMSCAEGNYISLAKEVFEALDGLTLLSPSERINEERSIVWESWSNKKDKLEELWWGLRNHSDHTLYQEELPLFRVFYKLDPKEFISTLQKSNNPYLISSFLTTAGIGGFRPRLSEWKRVISFTPCAFENDGTWNGSIILPLLLVEARNQLLQAKTCIRNPDTPLEELNKIIRDTVTSIAKLIIDTLTEYQNTSAIFIRWLPWLTRQILQQPQDDITNVGSFAFVDNALNEAISNNIDKCMLPTNVPQDALIWESWYYQCALASFAQDGHRETPEWEWFADEWRLTPDDWNDIKGKTLRQNAHFISQGGKETPGVAAYLLAYPIARSSSPESVWLELWNNAIVLREILEFGDSDKTKDNFHSRSEAADLLLLLFKIGLAIFDLLASRCSNNSSSESRTLVGLFETLFSSTSEMREIDSTLNNDNWLTMVQHLAVRRMIWEPLSESQNSSQNIQVFTSDDSPSVIDILSKDEGNVFNMAVILQSLLLNDSSSKLIDKLRFSSIDISEIIQSVKKLNESHPRKYPIDESQLQKLEELAKTLSI